MTTKCDILTAKALVTNCNSGRVALRISNLSNTEMTISQKKLGGQFTPKETIMNSDVNKERAGMTSKERDLLWHSIES